MKIVAPKSRIDWWDAGYCMTAEDSNFIYIPIPKCTSSYTIQILKLMCNFDRDNFIRNKNLLDKNKMIVLRDPLERWKSGIAQHFYQRELPMTENMLEYVANQFTLEAHSELQVRFLNGVDTDNCIFFMLDSNYTDNLKYFVTKILGKNYTFWNKTQAVTGYGKVTARSDFISKNSISDRPSKVKYKEILTKYFEDNPEYMIRLQSHLKPDFDLLSSVEFYNRETNQ